MAIRVTMTPSSATDEYVADRTEEFAHMIKDAKLTACREARDVPPEESGVTAPPAEEPKKVLFVNSFITKTGKKVVFASNKTSSDKYIVEKDGAFIETKKVSDGRPFIYVPGDRSITAII